MVDEKPQRGILFWALTRGIACFVASMVIAIPLDLLFKEGNPEIEKLAQDSKAFLMFVLLAIPLIETLIGQWLPIAIAGFFTRSTAVKVVASSIVFAALHIPNSWSNAVVVLLVVGPVFAYTFVRFREESRWRAYWATSLTHMVHNLLAGLLMLAGM